MYTTYIGIPACANTTKYLNIGDMKLKFSSEFW